jgi:hypothetical protein
MKCRLSGCNAYSNSSGLCPRHQRLLRRENRKQASTETERSGELTEAGEAHVGNPKESPNTPENLKA